MDKKEIIAKVSEERSEKIKEDQKRSKNKQRLMKAELVSLSPTSMLTHALSIAATELARLDRSCQAGELELYDLKKYAILINSMVKIAEESRLSRQQSRLEGKSPEEVRELVRKALETIENE